jgi:hypothetical protein
VTPEARANFLLKQKEHCATSSAPFFMPNDGRCYRCNRDIIPELLRKGEDGSKLVTGCPLCFRSYCD